MGIILENQKVVRKDPYLFHTCNCVLCSGMRLDKPLPYTEPRVLDDDLIAKFKDLMLNRNYFYKIKEVLNGIAPEVELTRCGGAVSAAYIHQLEAENCPNETRNELRHDLDYRQYLEENKTRMCSVVNKGDTFDEGNPAATLSRKTKRLYHKYESLDKIKTGKRKIRAHQAEAICKAYESFKGVKGSIFYQKNLESNPTVFKAVRALQRRKKREDDAESYQAAEKVSKEAIAGNSKTVDRFAGIKEGSIGHATPTRDGV